jgi:hypothetical protein
MAQASHAEPGHADGVLGPDHAAVHAQLARLLESPHFRNSKRSQALLRFVVQAALAGDQSSLKERCIGAAVFGREPAYDTAQDPIVRNAAIEVRKRLAQYYLEPEHAAELRVELPSGSYMPSFPAESGAGEPVVPRAAEPAVPAPAMEPAVPRPKAYGSPLRWIAVAGLVVMAAVPAFLWATRPTPAADLEAFWEPLFGDGSAIEVSIGQPTRVYRFTGPRMEELNRLFGGGKSDAVAGPRPLIAPDEVVWVAPEYLFLRDALAAFKVAAWIQSKGHASRLASVAQTNYSQLRHAPLVAIGAFNNAWSIRVTAELRFVFDYRVIDGVPYHCIVDRRHPTSVQWKVAQPASGGMSEDYAIVTRVFEPTTEKTVISVAGIETYGTLAASEFVTEPTYLAAALGAAPPDWQRKNVQFVLGTKVIDGTPGPPRILAAHFW